VGTNVPALLFAALAGIVCVLVTGWPVAAPIGALAAFGLPRLLRQTSGSVSIAKIEAVATWTEMLQGTLAASAGLGQAIIATGALSPDPIRPATEHLAQQIRSGVHPREALLQFAEEVGDPCADRVVCALLLAFSSRAQRLGELLHALAESTRQEVALRLRIETSRASVRSGVRTVVVFSVAFAAGLSVLARSYLTPFDSAAGQLVLLVVGGLYAGGLFLMVALARPPAPIRLLGPDVVER
jgi:Flp pilus assembly protein TadB